MVEFKMDKKRFFTSRQKAELITALKGRHELALKFEYLGKGAELWGKYAASLLDHAEIELIQNNIKEILKEIKGDFNLFYAGCGTGLKILPLLKILKNKNLFLVDISKEMLDLASKNIKKKIPEFEIKAFQFDFEQGNFAFITKEIRTKTKAQTNLIVFLGNTLGNLSDKERILVNFRESMTFNDWLLLGVHLVPKKITTSLRTYSGKPSMNFITGLLKELGIKFFKIKIIFNKKKSRFEMRAVITKPQKIKIDSTELNLKKNEQILLMYSCRFTISEIKKLITKTGFTIRKMFINPAHTHALVLCQPIKL